MFYSENILAKKGPLANIWLAANWDRKLSKSQILHTDISHTVENLVAGDLPPLALRLSGQLLLGVCKIYGRQVKYLLDDCGEALHFYQQQQQQQQETAKKNHLPGEEQSAKSQQVKTLVQELLQETPEYSVE